MEERLSELNRIVGIRGSFVCAGDGQILAHAMSTPVQLEQLSIAARVVAQTFQAFELSRNHASEVDLQFQEGRLILKNLRSAILVLYCDPNLNLPLVQLNAKAIIKKLSAELKARDPSLTLAKSKPPTAQVAAPSLNPPGETLPQSRAPISPGKISPLFAQGEGPLSRRLKQSSDAGDNKNELEPYNYEIPTVAKEIATESENQGTEEPPPAEISPASILEESNSNQGRTAPTPGSYESFMAAELEKHDAEARRLIQGAAERHLTLRASGAIAVHWHCHRPHPWLQLPDNYRILVFYAPAAEGAELVQCLSDLGYRPNDYLTNSSGDGRTVFDAQGWWFQLHVFRNLFKRLDVSGYLQQEPLSLSPTILILSYLQKSNLSEVEQRELSALSLDHTLEMGGTVPDQIDSSLVCRLLADDWLSYRTAEGNLLDLRRAASDWLEASEYLQVMNWIDALIAQMKKTPKTLAWQFHAVTSVSNPRQRTDGKRG